MKTRNKIGIDYSYAIDYASVINGGSAKSEIEVFRFSDHYLIEIAVPGVKGDEFGLEVNDNNLVVYHWIELDLDERHYENKRLPRTVRALAIPFDVDVREISAQYEEDMLRVYLPFNEFANGYKHKINILRDDHD